MRCQIHNTTRGKPPKVTSDTLHMWTLDETSSSDDARDVVGARDLPIVSSTIVRTAGPSRNGARFTGAAGSGFYSTANDDDDISGDLTVSILAREISEDNGVLLSYSGTRSGTNAEMMRFEVGFTLSGKIRVRFDTGASPFITLQSYETTNALPRRNWHNLITIRKTDQGGGLVNIEVWVNGKLWETIASGVGDYDNGANAEWRIAQTFTANTPFDGKIGFVHVETAALSAAAIANLHRRLTLQEGDRWVDMKVEVEDGDSPAVMRNLADLEGENFLRSIKWNNDVDAKTVAGTVETAASIDRFILHFLNESSKLNLTDTTDPASFASMLMAGRDVDVYRAILPRFIEASAADWSKVIEGEVDKVKSSGFGNIMLEFRDKGAIMGYTKIETPTWYSDLGTPAAPVDDDSEDVIQMILDDWHPDTPTLRVEDDISFALHGYEQGKMSIHEAIENITIQRAADCRLWQHPDTGNHEITYFLVGEDRTDADIVLTDDDYMQVTNLEFDRTRIRNKIEGGYYDDTLLDNHGKPKIQDDVVEDVTSQGKFGKQFMSFTEASTSQIDTAAELTAMLNTVLDALKDPEAYVSLKCRFLPEMTVHNLVYLPANDEMWTTAQTLAVQRISQTWSKPEATTTLNLRGKPVFGHRKILAREGGQSEYPSTTAPIYPIPGDVNLQSIVGGVRVSFPSNQHKSQQRKRGRHAHTEIHAQLGTGDFTPDATTLKAFGDKIDFEITDLLPGQDYRVKAIGVDQMGRIGTPIDLSSIDTKRAGPAYADPATENGSLRKMLRGGDFSSVSRGDRSPSSHEPDFWNAVTTWNTTMKLDTGNAVRGLYSLEMNTGGVASSIQSDLFPIQQGTGLGVREYQVDVLFRPSGDVLNVITIQIEYFSNLTTSLSTETIFAGGGPSSSYQNVSAIIAGNSSAHYARINIFTSGLFALKHYVDAVDIIELLPSWDVHDSAGGTIAASTWTVLNPSAAQLVVEGGTNQNWDASADDFTAIRECRVSISAGAWLNGFNASTGNYAQMAVFLNGTLYRLLGMKTGPAISIGGIRSFFLNGSCDNLALTQGDVIDVRIFHNAAGTITLSTDDEKVWINGRVEE